MSEKLTGLKRIPQFIQEVRQETRRVVWPTARETRMTTLVVFILAIIFAMYFMLVDGVIGRVIRWIIQ